jgi:molecular chaperone DnaK (HSP70)
MASPRYSIGIDLGTTNSSVAYVDMHSRARKRPLIFLSVPQFVNEGEVASRHLLPSFLYFPKSFEIPAENLNLPWGPSIDHIVGEFARVQATRLIGRVVTSAKSWLCHGKVDRRAPILPWGSVADEERHISPLDASSLYLAHLRSTWNHQVAKGKEELYMERQEVILTVPASFDEAARELTVAAARQAGLHQVVLLEEPQAAFYSWLFSYEESWRKKLKERSMAIVCDVGGGTTDFSLIKIDRNETELSLRRIAVGEHLMLGGDNMDMALANHIEQRYFQGEKKLDSQRWAMLCQECRAIKEKALEEKAPPIFNLTVAGRGSRLVGGALQAELTREEILSIILDGFYPETSFREEVNRLSSTGLREWGLPYAHEPAVTRHLASFLKKHLADDTLPDVILFNGGALKANPVQTRIVKTVESWYRELHKEIEDGLMVLHNSDLDLAVSAGAAYFGLVRNGKGTRIGGGTPRSYYVGIDLRGDDREQAEDAVNTLCLIPRDLLTESTVELTEREFSLLVGKPVSFSLFSTTTRTGDEPGEILTLARSSLEQLPPLFMVLESKSGESEIPIHLKAWITEIGTLELWCVSRSRKEKWKLQFALSGDKGSAPSSAVHAGTTDSELSTKARDLIQVTFQKKLSKPGDQEIKPRALLGKLEELSREKREKWSTAFNREIFDGALSVIQRRRSSPPLEATWLNIAGFSLRPGFGYPLDEWRVSQLWSIFPAWLQFNKDPQCRLEWWILWRRTAGGLDVKAQEELFTKIAPYFFPGKKHIKTFPGPPPNRVEALEILRMAASLEKVSRGNKLILGNYAADHLMAHPDAAAYYWILARVGARVPFAASAHTVLPPDEVKGWLNRLIAIPWHGEKGGAPLALSSLARLTGDRTRDIDEGLRRQVAERLSEEGCDRALIDPLFDVKEEEVERQEIIFGESLPAGLVVHVE